jgi:hypothetical protein
MRVLAVEHCELVAQYEDFDIFGTVAPTAQRQPVDDQADEPVETGHAPILAASEPAPLAAAKAAGQRPGQVFGTHMVIRCRRRFRITRSPHATAGEASRRVAALTESPDTVYGTE